MTIQPDILVDPREQEFWDQDPTILREPDPFASKDDIPDEKELNKVAIGIAAGAVVLFALMRTNLQKEQPKTPEEAAAAARRIWGKVTPGWLKVVVPAVAQAYRLGSTSQVSYSELERLASYYAMDLGDYLNETSTQALAEGFAAQLNSGWDERLAWVRASEAYGLDSRQMRSYVKGLIGLDKTQYNIDPVPTASRMAIDRAFMIRADRLGMNEAYKATQVGKNLTWAMQQSQGKIPSNSEKRWITAEDELVCEVCAPLNGKTVPVNEGWRTSDGSYVYAPGIHPNCRCSMVLVFPLINEITKAMPGDPYNRDEKGRFASKEQRTNKPSMFGERSKTASMFKDRPSMLQQERTSAQAAFFDKPRPSAMEMMRPSAAQMLTASAEEKKTKGKKKYTILYRPNEQGQLTQQVVEIDSESSIRPHENTTWMYANLVLDEDVFGINRSSVKKPGTIIDFSEINNPNYGDYMQMVHIDRSNSTEDNEVQSFAFEAAYNDAVDTVGMEMATNRAMAENLYGKKGEVANYNKIGRFLPVSTPQLEEFRRVLSGLSKQELIAVVENIERESGGPNLYMSNRSEDYQVSSVSPNEIADEILDAAALEIMDSQDALYGSGRMAPMYVTGVLNYMSQDIDTERIDRSRFDYEPDDYLEDIYMFKFNGWYGIEIGQFRSNDPSGALSGKYRVVSHKEIDPPSEAIHEAAFESPSEVGRMSNVFGKIHIVELEPVLEPLQKALFNLSAFKGGMTHAGR